MPPSVSVLIPCYNVEKYLAECLNSVVNQTLANIEIICINDGSKDGTLEILRSYAARDSRIKVIDKPNTGYGDSMNVGLDVAAGEYIGIVESDDFIDKDMFSVLYKNAIEHQLEISRSCYYEYKNGINTVVEDQWVTKNVVHNPNTDSSAAFWQAPAIWCAIYKRDWLKKNGIKFLPTPGASYQDTSFAFKCYACCTRFFMTNKPFLHYRVDNPTNSVSSSGKVFCVCDEWKEIYNFVGKDKQRFQHLYNIMPFLQTATYKWNFNRLSGRDKWRFLAAWIGDVIGHFLKGEVSFNLDSVAKRKIKKAFTKLITKTKNE